MKNGEKKEKKNHSCNHINIKRHSGFNLVTTFNVEK